MANVCQRCKRSMSSHDNHASCPQCRIAAGECSLDSENPCTICEEWTRRQWGKTETVLNRRQSEIPPTGETALVGSLPSTRSMDFVKASIDLLLPQKSLSRLVKAISRKIYWSARQTSKLSRFWWCKLKMGSTWPLVRPSRHPVRPLRHSVRHLVRHPCR